MLVKDRMTAPVITIGPRATLESALQMIEKGPYHSLPVTDRQGRLVGIITIDQIRRALSNSTELQESQSETGEKYVEDFMTPDPLVVQENTPIEEAARLITDYDYNSLPVVRDNFVVGIITVRNIVRIIMEMTSASSQGVRLVVEMNNTKGCILSVCQKIFDLGGNLDAFSTYSAESKEYKILMMKIQNVDKYKLKESIAPLVHRIIDIR